MGGGGGGEAAETPKGGPNDNVPQNPNAGDDGFGAGVAGGAIGNGMDYPYGASESEMSEDGRLGQPPSNPNEYGQPPPQEQGESRGGMRNSSSSKAGMRCGARGDRTRGLAQAILSHRMRVSGVDGVAEVATMVVVEAGAGSLAVTVMAGEAIGDALDSLV